MKLSLLLTPLTFALLASSALAQDLPAGPGKETLESVCGACHGADLVIGSNRTKAAWADTVEEMKGKGASGSDADFKAITDYLGKYFGPNVNVNTATEKDLKEQLELSDSEVAAIVKARTAGKIADYAALSKIDGVDAAKLAPLKSRLKY